MCGTAVVCSVVLATVGKTPLLVQEKAQFGELVDQGWQDGLFQRKLSFIDSWEAVFFFPDKSLL